LIGTCLVLVLMGTPIQAEIIDRIAVSVGNQVITEDQIREEIRVTAFMNRDRVDFGAEQKKAAAERLIEQTLIKREMEFSHYPLPALNEADELEKEFAKRYKDEDEFQQDMKRDGIREADLKRHLWWQVTTLRFIDYRFRPAIQVPDTELQEYYEQKKAEWIKKGVDPVPTFEQSRADIENVLTGQRVDQALDRWLGDTRTQVEILYRNEVFR
jgi:hypothetical protein